jgi:tRNA nucleotidyltransferase (CCA-adding enzyme)
LHLPEALNGIVEAIQAVGGRPLVVGGAVRDAALGLDAKDFDLEVYGVDVDALTGALSRVGKVHAVGRSFGVLKLTTPQIEVDVSLPRRESKRGRGHRGFLVEPDPAMTPREAASRRDFTINALAYDPSEGETLDFFGGLEDLERRRLRHVGPAFADDALRVLRGVQLAGRFALTAAEETLRLSRRLFAEIDTLAVERVWAEWQKWAAKSTRPSAGLVYLRDCGWREAYPELQALEGCVQDARWHPEGDVWTHTLLVADAAAAIAERDGLDETDRTVLLLTALCHDLGKPETTFVEGDRVRSPGHASRVKTLGGFLARMGCPRRPADRVIGLTRHHLEHLSFRDSARHVRRLSRSLGSHGETIAMLARVVEADHEGRPPLPGGMPDAMRTMLELARELSAADAAPKPLLQGRHLLEMGIDPGPRVGRILEAAYAAQLDGEFDDLAGARSWIEKKFPEV